MKTLIKRMTEKGRDTSTRSVATRDTKKLMTSVVTQDAMASMRLKARFINSSLSNYVRCAF